MHLAAVVAEKLLALVFLAAGATKLASGRQWSADAAQLGSPRVMVPFVPWWELAVGAVLAVGLARPWGAVAAALSLVAFSAALIRLLRRGQHPPCACFGSWSARPIGWGHVVRNAGFLALAAVAYAA